jgi:hypothetical protein
MLLLLLCLLLLHTFLIIFPTNYKLNAIFEWIDTKLRHYFLKLLPLLLDAVTEFSRESVGLLRGLAELRDNLIGLLGLRSEIL